MIDLLRLCLEPVLLRRRSLRRLLRLAAAMVLGAGLNAVLGWAGCGGGWTPVGILAGIALLLSLAEKFEPGPDYVAASQQWRRKSEESGWHPALEVRGHRGRICFGGLLCCAA